MTAVLVSVQIPSTTNEPRNNSTIDLVFDMPSITSGDIDSLFATIDSWINVTTAPAIFAPASRLSSLVSRTVDAVEYNFYDLTGFLDGSPHGSPFATRTGTIEIASSSALPLPNEAAACLSFRASYTGVLEQVGATRPRARRRGRFYWGPLNANTIESADGSVEDQLRISMAQNAETFLLGYGGGTWSVWSRMDAALYPVVAGWVDNAFDTQRRRGLESTNRVLFP